MNLTESQLFTIEALNRIDGFVWPEEAGYASIDFDVRIVDFWVDKPVISETLPVFENSSELVIEIEELVKGKHPDWRNSLITREQFESVDGWVRNDGSSRVIKLGCLIDVTICSGKYFGAVLAGDCFWSGAGIENVDKWRYHKLHKLQKEKGVTLLEILVRDLPKRGGWPNFADACVQNSRKNVIMLGEGYDVKFDGAGWGLKYGVKKSGEGNFASSLLATDHETKIVTRAEYEKAVKEAEFMKPLIDTHRACSNMLLVTELGDDQQSIEQLYDEYRKACVKVALAKGVLDGEKENRDSLSAKIKSWHKERGFDVSEVKPKLNPIVKVDVKLEPEPELKITDWRDLRIGDIVWWSGDSHNNHGEYEVCDIEDADYNHDAPICVIANGGGSEWIDTSIEQWKFIRRP